MSILSDTMEPMIHILAVIGEKWMLPIISLLFVEELRFSAMKKQLCISSRTLTRKLRLLESKGLVQRILDETGNSAYCLTETGQALYASLSKLIH
jgi:DNA-binding HxlR family transcriptional regulator